MILGLIAATGLIVLTAALLGRGRPDLVALAFIGYGPLIGVLTISATRSGIETNVFNLPGQALGEEVYARAAPLLGDPHADDAEATIPWILRRPQVYVPSSVLAWGVLGVLIWIVAPRRDRGGHRGPR